MYLTKKTKISIGDLYYFPDLKEAGIVISIEDGFFYVWWISTGKSTPYFIETAPNIWRNYKKFSVI